MPSSLVRFLSAPLAGGVALALRQALPVMASTVLSSLRIAGDSLIVGNPDLWAMGRWALLAGGGAHRLVERGHA